MIRFTCGHIEESYADSENHIAIRSQDREGNNAIDFIVVCDKCKKYYEKSNSILKTKEEQNDYLKIENEVEKSNVYKSFAKIDQNLIAAFLMGHFDSDPNTFYGIEQLNKDYHRWMKWRESDEFAEHCGDCTNQPMTCLRCVIDEYKEKADEFIENFMKRYED